ncbi:MAG: DNA translocase FtsK 4TM domain-containing protein [Nitrospirota bacterium]|nr:MAG: DNA translocase FtsK 4TM domain-containing protein [Nitrospirota bacterium]
MSIFPSARRDGQKGRRGNPSPISGQVVGIVLLTFGVMMFLSVVSFVPGDPILFVEQGQEDGVTQGQTSPHNLIGVVGSTIAFLLFAMIGGAAYLIPLFFMGHGIQKMLGEEIHLKYRHVFGSILAILSLSALFQFSFSSVPIFGEGIVASGLAGGIGGQWIAQILEAYLANFGSHLVLLSGLLVSLLLISPTLLVGMVRQIPHVVAVSLTATRSIFPKRDPDEESSRTIKPNKSVKINRSVSIRGSIGDVASSSTENNKASESRRVKGGVEDSLEEEEEEEEDISNPQDQAIPPVKGAVAKTYRLPSPVDLLTTSSQRPAHQTDSILETQSQILTQTLSNFGIEGKVTEVHPGPVITMYEFAPGPGIKVARIVSLADDLAMALKALRVRVVAPLPGKSTVGVEVPNPSRETVSLKDILTSEAFTRSRSKLALALGKDIYGRPVVADLRTMPHLLVAGATGAGKSVGINCMLLNILFSAHPDEVKLLLIDPKVLELQVYDGIPHLIRPVVTDPKAAARGLTWAVQEMERRYRLLATYGVRSIDAFNRKVDERLGHSENREDLPQRPLLFKSSKNRDTSSKDGDLKEEDSPSESNDESLTRLPYIVIIIDEFADLMMVAPKEVEDRIARLAQMARAAGIHLILATQRPSVDVVTGLIKANFPARVAYQVSSKIDSRTILDANGAEALLGKGDMLYMASGTGRIARLHGPFVSDDEVRGVVEWVKQQAGPAYSEDDFLSGQDVSPEDAERDDTYERARELVIESGQASASLIQRRLRVGYPRAARMIEQMEQEGLVSAPGRDGRREVLSSQAVIGDVG